MWLVVRVQNFSLRQSFLLLDDRRLDVSASWLMHFFLCHALAHTHVERRQTTVLSIVLQGVMRRSCSLSTMTWPWLFASTIICMLQAVSSFSYQAWSRSWRATKATRLSRPTSTSGNRENATLVIIDVENVRGKSNFQWTHQGLVESATEWRNTVHASDVLALVVDHGSIPSLHTGGPLDDRVGAFFSGDLKADDVIVSLVRDTEAKTVVVTADHELKVRCQKVSVKSTQLTFMEPVSFLSEIESLPEHNYTLILAENEATSMSETNNVMDNNFADSIRREVALRQDLQMLNRLLHPRGTCSNGKKRQISKKQRRKLVTRRDRARERLQELLEHEEQTDTFTSVLLTSSESSTLNGAVQAVKQNHQSSYCTESTYERQLLAERLRRRLDRAGTISIPIDEDNEMSPVYDILWNSRSDRPTLINGEAQPTTSDENESWNKDGRSLSSSALNVPRRFHNHAQDPADDVPSTLLRIVTISDTHGYENELFAHNKGGEKPHLLPPADVLIHCGDFSGGGSRNVKLQSKRRLDAFLAAQTHIPTKIVIRGNHDPHTPGRVLFPRSEALYVTKPMTMELPHNLTLGLRPFSRRGTILLLPPCDILVSHEPPFGILDLTYQRVRAGSMALRRAVESSAQKPSLWLCGHIHEGRGSVLHTFVDGHVDTAASTLVVNAANANAGRANRIVTGPVLINVVKGKPFLSNHVEWTVGVNADSSPVKVERSDSIQNMLSIMQMSPEKQTADNRRLLAVDLGLRTATVVLNGKGDILDVQDWRFTDHPQLEGALQGILHNHTITHVVVEGSDVKLVRIWRKAIETYNPDLPFARVMAEDWRESFLLPKERKNTQAAKDAAVLIAKQFWIKKLEHNSKSKLTKDAAEAILVGQYAIRILGWMDPKPCPVKRYANGNIAR